MLSFYTWDGEGPAVKPAMKPPMKTTALTKSEALVYAEKWIAKWNRRDVEAVLTLFSDDVVFTSPRAASVVGSTRIEGKAMLAKYWTQAIAAIQTIHFTLDYVIAEGDRLAIVYVSEINGKRTRAVEFLVFGTDGLIHSGEAMHGIAL